MKCTYSMYLSECFDAVFEAASDESGHNGGDRTGWDLGEILGRCYDITFEIQTQRRALFSQLVFPKVMQVRSHESDSYIN